MDVLFDTGATAVPTETDTWSGPGVVYATIVVQDDAGSGSSGGGGKGNGAASFEAGIGGLVSAGVALGAMLVFL